MQNLIRDTNSKNGSWRSTFCKVCQNRVQISQFLLGMTWKTANALKKLYIYIIFLCIHTKRILALRLLSMFLFCLMYRVTIEGVLDV